MQDYEKQDYEKQATEFLSKHGITFEVVPIDTNCPTWCEDDKHIHGYHYRVTFSRDKRKPMIVDFWNSYQDATRELQKIDLCTGKYGLADKYRGLRIKRRLESTPLPTAYDILACITHSDPGTFEDFCGDFGYDTDGRKALETYIAVQKECSDVQRMFGDCLDELAEIC